MFIRRIRVFFRRPVLPDVVKRIPESRETDEDEWRVTDDNS